MSVAVPPNIWGASEVPWSPFSSPTTAGEAQSAVADHVPGDVTTVMPGALGVRCRLHEVGVCPGPGELSAAPESRERPARQPTVGLLVCTTLAALTLSSLDDGVIDRVTGHARNEHVLSFPRSGVRECRFPPAPRSGDGEDACSSVEHGT